MLHIMDEHPHVPGAICATQSSVAMTSISLPHTNIPLSCLQKGRTLAMAFSSKPLALVQISIVEVASSGSVSQIVQPLSFVLVIARVLPVLGDKSTVTFAKADPQRLIRRLDFLNASCAGSTAAALDLVRTLQLCRGACSIQMAILKKVRFRKATRAYEGIGPACLRSTLDKVTLVDISIGVLDDDLFSIVCLTAIRVVTAET